MDRSFSIFLWLQKPPLFGCSDATTHSELVDVVLKLLIQNAQLHWLTTSAMHQLINFLWVFNFLQYFKVIPFDVSNSTFTYRIYSRISRKIYDKILT